MPLLSIALMSIPFAFVLFFWVLISYDTLANNKTRTRGIAVLTFIASVEIGIWAWLFIDR